MLDILLQLKAVAIKKEKNERSVVNFIDILGAAFTHANPKEQKDSQFKWLFALSGSACAKAMRQHDDEIDPRRKKRNTK